MTSVGAPASLLSLAVLAAVAACWGEGGPEAGLSRSATVTDSAGIRIVHSAAPAWAGVEESWSVDPVPAVDVGRDQSDTTQHLFEVAGVRRLADGRLAVADAGFGQIRFFDPGGRLLQAVGRSGEGPAEFGGIRSLFRCGGDTLVVSDRASRLQIFTGSGAFVRTETVVPRLQDRPLGIEGVSSDCRAMLARGMSMDPDSGPRITLHWSDFRSAVRDTVATFPGMSTYADPVGPRALPYGAWASWAAHDEEVYLGTGGAPEIRVYGRDGGVTRILRWSDTAEPVTEADRERFGTLRERLLRENPGRMDVPDPGDFSFPERKPFFAGIVVDDEGNLWIRPYPPDAPGFIHLMEHRRESPVERWQVFDPAGQWLGRMAMPAGLEVMDIHGGYVVGRWWDKLDVQHVRLHRIDRPAS